MAQGPGGEYGGTGEGTALTPKLVIAAGIVSLTAGLVLVWLQFTMSSNEEHTDHPR